MAELGGSVRHVLYALDAASGRVAWSTSVAQIGTKRAVLGGKSGPVYVLKQGDLSGIAVVCTS